MSSKKRRRVIQTERERRKRQQTLLVIGVAVAAVVFVVILAILSSSSDGGGASVFENAGGGSAESAIPGDSSDGDEAPSVVEGTEVGESADLVAGEFPYLGSPDAPVKIVEYSDYFCGHCANFNADKAPRIEDEYVATGKVQFVAPYYALGQDARLLVVEAAACAADQGQYYEYRRLLFANQRKIAETPVDQWKTLLMGYAREIGLDIVTFETCWDQGQHQGQILASMSDAYQKGVNSTPTFLINGEKIVGNVPYEQFQAKIQAALKDATQ